MFPRQDIRRHTLVYGVHKADEVIADCRKRKKSPGATSTGTGAQQMSEHASSSGACEHTCIPEHCTGPCTGGRQVRHGREATSSWRSGHVVVSMAGQGACGRARHYERFRGNGQNAVLMSRELPRHGAIDRDLACTALTCSGRRAVHISEVPLLEWAITT
jgi:hypothetical protein